MGIVEKTHAAAPSTLADVDRFRLRRFVEGLGDELETVREPDRPRRCRGILEGNPKAVLFRAVGPERQELVGNVTGSRARIARAFGVKPNELLPELQRRLRSKPDVLDVSRAEAPVQEVVLHRRRRRSHHASGPSPARRRWRALHLLLDRLRGRSEDRLGPMSACAA